MTEQDIRERMDLLCWQSHTVSKIVKEFKGIECTKELLLDIIQALVDKINIQDAQLTNTKDFAMRLIRRLDD